MPRDSSRHNGALAKVVQNPSFFLGESKAVSSRVMQGQQYLPGIWWRESYRQCAKDLLPDVPAFRCWNHIFTNAKLKLQKLKLTEQKIQSWYVDALEYLFGQETELEYYKALNKFTSNSSLWHKVIFSKTVKYELKRRSLFFNFRNLPSITTGASKRK